MSFSWYGTFIKGTISLKQNKNTVLYNNTQHLGKMLSVF